MNWRALGVLVLLARSADADIVTLKNGREIEGLVVDMDDERLVVRRAGEGITQNWQLMRSEISSVRLAPPELAGFRTVARRFEADRALGDAADAWRKICTLRPEGAADQVRLLQVYRRANKIEDAAAALQTAVRVHPKDPKLVLEQGEIALAQGRAPDAVASAREVQKLTTTSSEDASWLLARGLEQSNQPAEALDALRALIKDQPRRSDALERFTELALEQGKADLAVEEAERVTRVAPDLRSGWIALGKIRYRQGRYADAVAMFQSATRLGGPDYDRARIFLQCALARRYDRNPRTVLTATDLEIAPQLDPELRREQP